MSVPAPIRPVRLLLVCVALASTTPVAGAETTDTTLLHTYRDQLYSARTYRLGYPTTKTRKTLRDTFRQGGYFTTLVNLRKRFASFLVSNGVPTPTDDPIDGDQVGVYNTVEKEEATRRMREAVNETIDGQIQLGNDYLLSAGRRKFPSVITPSDRAAIPVPYGERDDWKELSLAGLEFEAGILEALETMRTVPTSALEGTYKAGTLRSRGGAETTGTPAEGFANYTVVDQAAFINSHSEFLRTEYSLLFSALNRRGLASTALVDRLRRLAFRENNQVDPAQRHGEAGEVKKEDLNRKAIGVAKRDAQLMFYTGLVLRSQLPATTNGSLAQDDFKLHQGDKAFAAMSQLNLQFKDIRDGRLPSGLADQFVPSPNKRIGTAGGTGYLSDAITAVTRAKESQNIAETRVREYQQGQVSHVEFNRSIREQYLTQLGALTGFVVNPTTGILSDPADDTRIFSLKTPDDRAAFLALLDAKLSAAAQALDSDDPQGQARISTLGQLGASLVAVRSAFLGADLAMARADEIPARMQAIDDKATRSNALTKKLTEQKNLLAGVSGVLNYLADVAGATTDKTRAAWFATSALKDLVSSGDRIASNQISQAESIEFRNLDAESQVRELAIGMNAANREVSIQQNQILAAQASFQNQRRQVSDLVENLAEYRADAANLYFLDSSLEVEKVDAELQADQDLQDCVGALYDLTRAMEFYWTEKFQNPVMTVDGGIVTLPHFADDFTEIDDLYAMTDAFDAEKYLNSVGFAVSGGSSGGWDSTLRALRQSIPATNQTVVLSLRQDVLGFTVPERGLNTIAGTEDFGTIVQIHENGQIVPGREDLYQLYENEAITKFRDRLQSMRRTADEFAFGTNRNPLDFTDGFEFQFSTNDKSTYFFDAREWNARIQSIGLDLRTEGGFIPPGQEENFVRLNLVQEGTVSFARSFPLEVSDRQFDVYQTETQYQSDRLRTSAYEFPVQASINGSTGQFGGQPATLPYFFSPICSNWRIVLDPMSSLANNYTDINKIKDIRIVLTLRSGIPPTVGEGL